MKKDKILVVLLLAKVAASGTTKTSIKNTSQLGYKITINNIIMGLIILFGLLGLFGVAYYIYDTYNEKKIEKQFK